MWPLTTQGTTQGTALGAFLPYLPSHCVSDQFWWTGSGSELPIHTSPQNCNAVRIGDYAREPCAAYLSGHKPVSNKPQRLVLVYFSCSSLLHTQSS